MHSFLEVFRWGGFLLFWVEWSFNCQSSPAETVWSWAWISLSVSLWSDRALTCWYAGNGSGTEKGRGRKEDVEWWTPLYLHKPFEVDKFTPLHLSPHPLWPLPPCRFSAQGQGQARDMQPNTMGRLILAHCSLANTAHTEGIQGDNDYWPSLSVLGIYHPHFLT